MYGTRDNEQKAPTSLIDKVGQGCSELRAKKKKQGNRGDMRKIPMTRQFFVASAYSGSHGDFF